MTTNLHQGDCLEILKSMPSDSIDLIFADPPFNVGKKYGGKSDTDKRDDYYHWCSEWIEQGFRVLKDTGSFYLMTISRHVFRMGYEMEKHGVYINKVEWRNVSALHGKRGFWPSTQPIVAFGKTENYKFNIYAQRRKVEFERWGGYTTQAQGTILDYWDDIKFVYAGSITHPEAILKDGTNEKAHPAQMPVGLPTRAILFSTDEGDTVLDPFNGSGTTGVACIQTNRNYIGIEREEIYCDLSRKRWSDTKKTPTFWMEKEKEEQEKQLSF